MRRNTLAARPPTASPGVALGPLFFFFLNDPPTTEIYPLSLHDALPISTCRTWSPPSRTARSICSRRARASPLPPRSEEHTSELQSQSNLVCRLLLEKKKIASTDASEQESYERFCA